MLLAQLSDPHLTTGPLSAEPASGLYAALGRALALEPSPDCVLISGDLADHGHPEKYEALREILAGVPIPAHLMAGNHDDRGALLQAFARTAYLGGSERARYRMDYPEATLVVLDDLDLGRGGVAGSEQTSSPGSTRNSAAGRPCRPSSACTTRRSPSGPLPRCHRSR